ncbi:hypothetical protein Pcinc_023179 [Petrolisthes cinctipes]|uniref:Major facilitator superfamily (MFS) profile domain-containing protein n=1 Tax=Petrolisthes cinctipes TaxID=88211 RepID=A0AAE1FCS8_PETCI|nr:hypothetical protein Pcinc_023179 [Petrolisthes cinctipes]
MTDKVLLNQESKEPFIQQQQHTTTTTTTTITTTQSLGSERSGGGGLTVWVLWAVTYCLLGSCLPAGYCLGVINTPQEIIRSWVREALQLRYGLELSDGQEVSLWSVVVSLFVVGAIVGASLGPLMADRAGRCTSLLLNHLLTVASAFLLLGCRAAGSVEMLVLGRFTTGLFSGVATWLVPLYLCEVGPPEVRGVMGVTLPLGMCLGLLVSQVLGMDILLGTVETWPYLLGGFIMMVMVALMMHPLLPESPTYCFLVAHNQAKGRAALQRLRGKDSKCAEAEESTLKMLSSLRNSQPETESLGVISMFKSQQYRMPLIITVILNAGQQLSGINAVFYYSTLIFRSAGLDQEQSQAAAIGTGVMNVIMAILAIPLVKFCRRRVLLLVSVIVCVLCQAALILSLHLTPSHAGAPYVAIVALVCYVMGYGIGLGPVPYMVATELFAVGPRSVGISLGGTTNWGSNLVVGLTFPLIQELLREFSFTFFIAFACLVAVFVYRFVPETLSKDTLSSPMTEEERMSEDEKSSEDGITDIPRTSCEPCPV